MEELAWTVLHYCRVSLFQHRIVSVLVSCEFSILNDPFCLDWKHVFDAFEGERKQLVSCIPWIPGYPLDSLVLLLLGIDIVIWLISELLFCRGGLYEILCFKVGSMKNQILCNNTQSYMGSKRSIIFLHLYNNTNIN